MGLDVLRRPVLKEHERKLAEEELARKQLLERKLQIEKDILRLRQEEAARTAAELKRKQEQEKLTELEKIKQAQVQAIQAQAAAQQAAAAKKAEEEKKKVGLGMILREQVRIRRPERLFPELCSLFRLWVQGCRGVCEPTW